MSHDNSYEIEQIIKDLEKHVSFIPFSEVIDRAVAELDATNPEDIVSFGYEWMDEKMTGIFPGDLILIGGESGTGKTTFATNILYKASQKHRCAIFALEDRLNNYGINAVYFELGRVRKAKGMKNYPWNAYRRNEIEDTNYKLLRETAVANLSAGKGNLYFADVKVQMDIDMLETAIKAEMELGTKLFLIDHLHYFDLSKGDNTKADYIEQLMVRLKGIQRLTGASIILVAHYRKMNGQKPTMDSFKDSISIVQNANYVINMWRDRSLKGDSELEEEFETRFDTKIMVPKSRNPNGEFTIDVRFDPDTNDFTNPQTYYGTPDENSVVEQANIQL